MAEYQHIRVEHADDVTRITMDRAARRNSLSAEHLAELLTAFREVAATDAVGVVLAGEGPVFSAGHDFADVSARDLEGVRDAGDPSIEVPDDVDPISAGLLRLWQSGAARPDRGQGVA